MSVDATFDIATGKLTIPAGTDIANRNIILDLQAQNKVIVGNELGINRQLHGITKAEAAIANPGQYLTNRKNAIVAARDNAQTKYIQVYQKLLADGLPEAVAKEKALKVSAALADVDLTLVEEDYPVDIAAQILGTQISEKKVGYKKTLGLLQ